MNLTNAQKQVRDFMIAAGQWPPVKPAWPDKKSLALRLRLHKEEGVIEFKQALDAKDMVSVADSIADTFYVVLGTAVAFGLNIEPIFNEVHKSNMTKFIDGYRRKDGKWVKGPSFRPPNLAPLILNGNAPLKDIRCPKGNCMFSKAEHLRSAILDLKKDEYFHWPNNKEPYQCAKQVHRRIRAFKTGDGRFRIYRRMR